MSGRTMSLVFGIPLTIVSISRGGSVPRGTSNYRTPMGKRARSTAAAGTRLSANISYVSSPRGVSFRHFQGGSVSPDTSNYTTPKGKRDLSKEETGARLS